jgi:glycosyltransferase involved in cell wall biosynthesis
MDIERIPSSALFVGRLDTRKGFPFLLDAWRQVVARHPEAKLYVLGSGPLRHKADEYLSRHGISSSVEFLAHQPEAELAGWYNRVQVVVVPSVFEGFGLAALEAMACGTRVVATDVDGLRDVVTRREYGALAPFGDARAFGGAVLAEFEESRRLSRSCVAEIAAACAWPVVAERYAETYAQVMESRG